MLLKVGSIMWAVSSPIKFLGNTPLLVSPCCVFCIKFSDELLPQQSTTFGKLVPNFVLRPFLFDSA